MIGTYAIIAGMSPAYMIAGFRCTVFPSSESACLERDACSMKWNGYVERTAEAPHAREIGISYWRFLPFLVRERQASSKKITVSVFVGTLLSSWNGSFLHSGCTVERNCVKKIDACLVWAAFWTKRPADKLTSTAADAHFDKLFDKAAIAAMLGSRRGGCLGNVKVLIALLWLCIIVLLCGLCNVEMEKNESLEYSDPGFENPTRVDCYWYKDFISIDVNTSEIFTHFKCTLSKFLKISWKRDLLGKNKIWKIAITYSTTEYSASNLLVWTWNGKIKSKQHSRDIWIFSNGDFDGQVSLVVKLQSYLSYMTERFEVSWTIHRRLSRNCDSHLSLENRTILQKKNKRITR